MPRMRNKNQWAAAGLGVDPQRSDLFKVTLQLPPALGGASRWTDDIEFAIEKFPFPNRLREVIPIKYLNQTNYAIGADTQTESIEVPVRYAFNQPTVQLLERWNYLTSNPETGGVALASQVKCNGRFRWLVPNMAVQKLIETASPTEDTMVDGLVYRLEGCMIRGFKFSDADMTSSNGIVTVQFNLQIDRYYPENIGNMVVGGALGGFTGGSIPS